ncbi:MAG: hypothetical protein WBP64_05320 [Nitrososphaeraceae archaeon]
MVSIKRLKLVLNWRGFIGQSKEQSKSDLPMFGAKFPAKRKISSEDILQGKRRRISFYNKRRLVYTQCSIR